MNERNKGSIILFSIGAGLLFGAAATMNATTPPHYCMYFLFASQFFVVAGALASSAHFTRRLDESKVNSDNERQQIYTFMHSQDDRKDNEMDALRRELAQVESRICSSKPKDSR